MAYATTTTQGDLVAKVKNFFRGMPDFETRTAFAAPLTWYDMVNRALDEIYHATGYQPDKFSFTSTVGASEVAISGAGSSTTLPNEIDFIARVDYDGDPLSYRYDFNADIIPPGTADANDVPDGWYERWDNGARILGFPVKCSAAVTVDVYASRKPTVIAADATVPPVENDFLTVLEDLMIWRCYQIMQQAKEAADYWMTNVERGLFRMKVAMERRQGKSVERMEILNAEDMFE